MLLFKRQKERRFFARINCNVPCSVYGSDIEEDAGAIQNISEEGMFIAFKTPGIAEKMNINDRLTIQLLDRYSLFNRDNKVCLNVAVQVVRKEVLGIGCMVIGQDENYIKYVSDKKIINYLENKGV